MDVRITRKPRCLASPRRRLRRIGAILLLLSLIAGSKAQAGEPVLEFDHPSLGWSSALALDSAVEMRVHGLINRVVLRQRYVNDSEHWLEGRYLLPLPEDAAVDHLQIRIGDRLIVGEVQEKAAARATYAAAASSGRRAALVEQDRPNLFRTGLTNIGPGEEIELEIGYWQAVGYRDGEFVLALPLTLTPRYTPALGGSDPAPANLPAQAAQLPPALEPTVSLRVELRAGLPLARIHSPTHRIAHSRQLDFDLIELEDYVELADRDFELRWQPLPSRMPQRAVFHQQVDGDHYALALLIPPTVAAAPLPRELVLVIDNSGSMQGTAMRQAIAALDSALLQLRADDRFNLVRFNHLSERLFAESMPASADNVDYARRYVAGLSANGGTEMAPALRLAFDGEPWPGHVRQVVLATDAAISNESALFELIERERGGARLFPVGIGSAPNGHFIRKAAELGRGSQVLIRDLGEVAAQMEALFARIDRPLLHDIELDWPDAAEVYPQRLPDLYHGEPLQIVARLPFLQGELGFSGLARDKRWHSKLALQPALLTAADGIGRLWARARIEALEDARRAGAAEAEVRAAIVEVALAHGLASRYTSLVAVERTPARPPAVSLASTAIANARPADSLVMAQGASTARSKLGMAIALLLMVGALLRRPAEPTLRAADGLDTP
jgi:Ca-activated chloride channel homolog